jgi:protein TonB
MAGMTSPFALPVLALALAAQDAPPPNLTNTPVGAAAVAAPGPSAPGVVAPVEPAARIVRPPQERGTAQSYVSPDDYPAAARASGAVGRVGFTLTIDSGGRVIGCTITRSSGSSVLDYATCNLMRRRARFTPAMDSNGNPAVGIIAQELEWKAP